MSGLDMQSLHRANWELSGTGMKAEMAFFGRKKPQGLVVLCQLFWIGKWGPLCCTQLSSKVVPVLCVGSWLQKQPLIQVRA